jgi:hypothetical protein
MSYEEMIKKIIIFHFNQYPTFIRRITIGICNEVYNIGLNDKEVIIRLSPVADSLTDMYIAPR